MKHDIEIAVTFCLRLLCGLMLCSIPISTTALTLAEAYQAALTNDPTYQVAIHDHEASLEAVPLARAALLPQLSFVGGYSSNSGTQTTFTDSSKGTLDQNPNSPTYNTIIGATPAGFKPWTNVRNLDYISHNWGVNLRWNLLNLDAVARFRQAHAQESMAEARFDAAYNDLVVRIASAYFDALLANDTRDYALAQVEAYEHQLMLAQKRWNAGEGTRTDIAETEARLATARAELISAEDQIAITTTNLRQITGGEVTPLKILRADFVAQPIEPSRLETWQEWALELSPTLIMQRHAVEAARRDVDRNRAGHLPTVAIVGSMVESASDSAFFTSSTTQINSIGFQTNIPLYGGGAVSAAVSQSEAALKRNLSDLEAKTNTTLLETQKQLRNVLSGIEQIGAHQKAVDSQLIAIKGIEAGIRLGTRIHSEVLDAQRLMFQSKRSLASARYQYLMSRLRLTSATRLITEEDLLVINSALQP